MLVTRYGITVCCDEDINMLDIRKQLLDLDMLKDPNLCKSTLCCCPAPCLIDVVITVLPFCGRPAIISAIIDMPCPAPVLIGVEIDVEVIPAPCYCWKVDYTILQPPLILTYIDCCCITQTQIIDISGEGSVAICSATAPVSFTEPIVVTNQGLCDEADLCNPPPPQDCICWRISNIGPRVGTYLIGAICPGGPIQLGVAGSIPPGSPDVYVCSIQPPLVTDLSFYNMGPCDGYCGPTPPACVCYKIEVTNPAAGCAFYYTDCNGVQVTDFIPSSQVTYVCALTVPAVSALSLCALIQPPAYTVSSTPFSCVNGVCGPPLPCICYEIGVFGTLVGVPATITYFDCAGVFQSVDYYDGTYAICAGSVPFSLSPAVTGITPTIQDCALGECLPPYTNCVCYDISIPFDGVGHNIHYQACNGTPFTELFATGGSYRRCSQITPTCVDTDCTGVVIAPSFLDCNSCTDPPLPVPCVCYQYQNTNPVIPKPMTYTDCSGNLQVLVVPAGSAPGSTGYICAQGPAPSGPFIIVSSTPLNCGLGECHP
jgi:hypothetical protein